MVEFSFPEGRSTRAAVLGIGVFDGVHLGHRRIIAELCKMGRECDAEPVAVTFFPHPRAILCPASPPRLLLPPEERLRRLHAAGAKRVAVIDFSSAAAATPPEIFLDELLNSLGTVRGVCVGEHWRFGLEGKGDTAFLAREMARRGIRFEAVPEVRIGGDIVSSSGIRDATAAGELAEATNMLGALPCLYGEVEAGSGVAGTQLHAPTANLKVEFGVLPPDGVYATRCEVEGGSFAAVTNIGFSPTFGGTAERRVESHLIGFSGDIYRKKLTVKLVSRLRGEKKFTAVADLEKQIREDREKALELLSREAEK